MSLFSTEFLCSARPPPDPPPPTNIHTHAHRNAPIYAEILGYGVNGDAFHATAPDPDGNGALRAMQRALATSKRSISDLDYINAHATSTPLGDEIEIKAIQQLLQGEEEFVFPRDS